MQILIDFFHEYAAWILVVSFLSFIIGLISIPLLVARIPADYFSHHSRRIAKSRHSPTFRLALICLKNMLGVVLLFAGFIMLFTPGQGLLTILFGLMIMNYPGKYRLECWIIKRPFVFTTINTIRRKKGQPPLLSPESSGEG